MIKSDKVRVVKETAYFAVLDIFSFLGALIPLLTGGFIFYQALPVIKTDGVLSLLFGDWSPATGSFGVLAMLLCTLICSLISVSLAMPAAVLGAAFLKNLPPIPKRFFRRLANSLSGLPSVIFGLLGLKILVPRVAFFSPKSGGAGLIASILVLWLMLLPRALSESMQRLEGEKESIMLPSLALGATKGQTEVLMEIPALKEKFLAEALSLFCLCSCEASAVLLVSGNVVNLPSFFCSVRLLSPALALEMGYAAELHRSALFFIGVILLALSLILNLFSNRVAAGDREKGDRWA